MSAAEPTGRIRRKGGKKSIWDATLDARLLQIIEEEDGMAQKEREQAGVNAPATTQRNWKRIAQKLGEGDAFGRRQCQERFVNHINPAAEERQVSREESKILCELFQLPEYGRNWSKLSQEIHRRDPSKKPHVPLTLKNRFWSSVRKARRCLARKKPLTPKLKTDIANDPVLNFFMSNESKLPPQTSNANKRKQSAAAGARSNKKRRGPGDPKEEDMGQVLLQGVVSADSDPMGGLTEQQYQDFHRMKMGMGAPGMASHDMALRQLAIQRYNPQGHDGPAAAAAYGGHHGSGMLAAAYGAPPGGMPASHPSVRMAQSGEDPQQQARFALDSMKLNSANVPTFSQGVSSQPSTTPQQAAATASFQQHFHSQMQLAQLTQQRAAAAMFTNPAMGFPNPFGMFGNHMFMSGPAAAAAAQAVNAASAAGTAAAAKFHPGSSLESGGVNSPNGDVHKHAVDAASSSAPSSSSTEPTLAAALTKHLTTPQAPPQGLPMPGDPSAMNGMSAHPAMNAMAMGFAANPSAALAAGAPDSAMAMQMMATGAANFYNPQLDIFKRFVGTNGAPMASQNPFKGGSGANVGNSMLSPESPRAMDVGTPQHDPREAVLHDPAMRAAAVQRQARSPAAAGGSGGARSPDGGVADPNMVSNAKTRLTGIPTN